MNNHDDSQEKTNNERPLTPAELALLEALDTLDAPVAPVVAISPEALRRAAEAKERYHGDAKRNGRTAQKNREIDRERREEGRTDYNLSRRAEYGARINQTEDRDVRPYAKLDGLSQEAKRRHRLDQMKASKDRKKLTETPAEIEERRRKDRERKAAKRAAT